MMDGGESVRNLKIWAKQVDQNSEEKKKKIRPKKRAKMNENPKIWTKN